MEQQSLIVELLLKEETRLLLRLSEVKKALIQEGYLTEKEVSKMSTANKLSSENLIEKINTLFDVNILEVTREQTTVFARFLYMKYAREVLLLTFGQIAKNCNVKCHTTVHTALKKFETHKKKWPLLANMETRFNQSL